MTSQARQTEWDQHVQKFRTQVLKRLLDEAATDEAWHCRLSDGERVLRLETLLWGGDELIWVVPAWKGWSTVQAFLDEAVDFYEPHRPIEGATQRPRQTAAIGRGRMPTEQQRRQQLEAEKKQQQQWEQNLAEQEAAKLPCLTHGIGVVFFHADAPIQTIRNQAVDLVDLTRQRNVTEHGDKPADIRRKYQNVVSWLVLESYDNLGSDMLEARARNYPAALRQGPNQLDPLAAVRTSLTRTADEFTKLTDMLCQVKQSGFPRGSIYRLVRAWQVGADDEFRRWLTRAQQDWDSIPGAMQDPASGDDWLHLTELWDYLPAVHESARREVRHV